MDDVDHTHPTSVISWVIAIVSRKMALNLHRIMKYPADPDQIGFQHTIEQKMSRISNKTGLVTRPFPAITQVVAAHFPNQLGASIRSWTKRIECNVAQGSNE